MTVDLFAGLAVRDRDRAVAWYSQLLGREPAFFPNEREAVWEVAESRHVYVVADAARAGGGVALLFVDDLADRVERIHRLGVDPVTDETYDNGVRKVVYRDADGNDLGFGGAAG
jgi:catechol 2,3-dioxygenase-like lactoylglutathione lyase family enzyme